MKKKRGSRDKHGFVKLHMKPSLDSVYCHHDSEEKIQLNVVWNTRNRYYLEEPRSKAKIHFGSIRDQAEHHALMVKKVHDLLNEVERLQYVLTVLKAKEQEFHG